MKQLVESILNKKYDEAEDRLNEAFRNILERKMYEMKKQVAAKMCEEDDALEEEPDLSNIIRDNKTGKLSMKPGTRSNINFSKIVRDINTGNLSLKEEEQELDEGRINIVKVRVRGGKIQRRMKVSNVAGFTMRAGKLTRMSPTERRKRKLGAKKAARKSRAKRSQMLRKRRMSLMKRKRLGV
jgi:hypothetical protein